MTNSAQFDRKALAAVQHGMDDILTEIGAHMERYLGAPADNAADLKAARAKLHRLLGVLKMVGLDGVAVFCAKLETVLGELATHPQQISGMHREVMRRVLSSITHYLDALADGADNTTLRLFPQYQELQQLRGVEMAFELDLFYPNLAVQLPPQVLSAHPEGDKRRLNALRRQYQQGLMKWLRQDDSSAALQMMQQALDGAMRCMPQDNSRAFWWVGCGLLDCLKFDGLPPELNARTLLGRIDQQMRSTVAEDGVEDIQPILNEMLYLIGRSHVVSELADAIKQTYSLDHYLPDFLVLPPGKVVQLLSVMHDQLRATEESWELCTQGDKEACKRFVEHAKQLAVKSEKLDPNTLQYPAKQIQALSQYADTPERAQLIAMDMAMLLLLLRSGIENYIRLDNGFQEQVRILSERVQTTAQQQPEDMQRLTELVDLHYQMQQSEMLVPLANEMLANLQHIEQGLNAFFSNAVQHDELKVLLRLLTQIQGGLCILSLDEAEQLLVSIQNNIRHFTTSDAAPKPMETRALADAVSALESYLQHLTHGQAGDPSLLRAAATAMAKLRPTSAQLATDTVVQHQVSAQIQRPINEDQELLEVFLEEAQEVLGIMRDNLEICQLHPDSQAPLVIIKRGFHTLKGSGRMVGLTDFGEVAWCIERAMNNWLQSNKPDISVLLRFIKGAVQSFTGWVDALNNQGGVRIEASDLIIAAQHIENGLDPETQTATSQEPLQSNESPVFSGDSKQVLADSADIAQPAPAKDTIVIGGITLSRALFNIASAESKQHVLMLHEQLGRLRTAAPPVVQYDFMRAAHTLTSINRTLGFTAIVDLAHALENWLHVREEQAFTLSSGQLHMLERSIAALDGMVQSICNQQMPQMHSDLVDQLLTDKDKLHEAAIVPVSAPDQTGVRTGADKPRVRDDVDKQLLPVFLNEADDLCPKIAAGLRAWREQPDDNQQIGLLKRLLHTIKGSSRMVGAMRIGEIAHEMEDRILMPAQLRDEAGYWDMLENDFDRITTLIEELRSGNAAPVKIRHTEAGRRAADLEIGRERALLGNMLRVRSDVVDQLVNSAGEISVARSRMETELRAFKEGLLELTGSVTRLRQQLREVEIQTESQMQARTSLAQDNAELFDPLELDRFTRLQELTRFMNESVHDVEIIQQSLLKNIDETNATLLIQGRLNRDLQQGLMNVRMVPFNSITDRLYRIVRQTGKELNKRANLELLGADVELDRSVLEKMTAPFEHLLRNAIAHGLESDQLRAQTGKQPIGEIRLSVRQENNEVVFTFSDDGAGLNFAMLREKAIAKGLLQEDEIVSESQLAQLIFISGLSTASEITEIAGRGIGMDVVRSEIAALGGRIDVSSQSGRGTQFIIHLPLTLAVTQTLMVRAGKVNYAIPSTIVEQVNQVKLADMAALYQKGQVEWLGKIYPLHYLPHLLGDAERVAENQLHNSVLLLCSGEQRIALHVDELLGNQESVVKNIGPQLEQLPGIAGATVQGDGMVILILNPVQLAQRIGSPNKAAHTGSLHTQPLIMVVDDSLTVRKVTTRMLTRAGYQVVTAKDGVDALQQLEELDPAAMLLDIEMPRMDGFELTKQLRSNPKTQNLPIIIITSRTADKHRDYAMGQGVNAYLGKPYQEDELLRRIADFAAAHK